MKELTDGRLFEIARDKMYSYGYALNGLTWDSSSQSMGITYSYIGCLMRLTVKGLPEDIPANVFNGLLDHLVKTEILRRKKVEIDQEVIEWLNQTRAAKRINA